MAGQEPWLDEIVELAEAFMCESIRGGGDCDGHPPPDGASIVHMVSGPWAAGRCEMALRVRERIRGLRAGIDFDFEKPK